LNKRHWFTAVSAAAKKPIGCFARTAQHHNNMEKSRKPGTKDQGKVLVRPLKSLIDSIP